jgi:hypothetical protein
MVPVVIAGNISGEATTPSGNILIEATRRSVRKTLDALTTVRPYQPSSILWPSSLPIACRTP